MKRGIVVLVVLALVVAALPWAIGWRAEQLVRARVAEVDADKSADIRLRIDSYRRGWRGSNAQISVIDRAGASLVRLDAAIRHWPFANGGPADWVAVPEFGGRVAEALGPWGAKLPELTTRTSLSWRGDMHTRIESAAFKRRVPEFAGGTVEIAALSGMVDWRRDGALRYEFALPVFRVERQGSLTRAPDVVEFRDATLKGDGFLGTAERRFRQKGSLAAGTVSITQAGTTMFTAATPRFNYESRDDGEYVALQFTLAVASVSARHALADLSDATIEIGIEAGHLAKEPLGRMLDARAEATSPGRASASSSQFEQMSYDLMRGSPTADLQFQLRAREGRVEIKLVLSFDGVGLAPRPGLEDTLTRLDARLEARATTSLVIAATREWADAAAAMFRPPAKRGGAIELPDAPAIDPSAAAQRHLNEAAAHGFVRFEGDEVVTTMRWHDGQLTVNGRNMNALRDMARGMTGR